MTGRGDPKELAALLRSAGAETAKAAQQPLRDAKSKSRIACRYLGQAQGEPERFQPNPSTWEVLAGERRT